MPSGRVEVEVAAAPGDRPDGPGERRLRERRRRRARPSRPPAPVTATRTQASRLAATPPGGPRTGARSRRPSRRTAPRATTARWRGTSRPWPPARRRTASGCASRGPRASSRPSRSGGRGRAGPATRADQRPRLAEPLEQRRDHVAVRHLGASPGCCRSRRSRRGAGRARSPPAWSDDVQPVALLQAVAVHRQRLVVDRVRDEQRDELLGVVVRPVRVRAAGDDGVEAVGHDVAADEQLAGGLGGRVRRARVEPVASSPRVARRRPSRRPRRSRPGGSGPASRRARSTRSRTASSRTWTPIDAGPQERLGIEDAPVDVRLGGEVDDRVGVGDERPDDRRVGDVALRRSGAARPARDRPRPAAGWPGCRRRSACRGP